MELGSSVRTVPSRAEASGVRGWAGPGDEDGGGRPPALDPRLDLGQSGAHSHHGALLPHLGDQRVGAPESEAGVGDEISLAVVGGGEEGLPLAHPKRHRLGRDLHLGHGLGRAAPRRRRAARRGAGDQPASRGARRAAPVGSDGESPGGCVRDGVRDRVSIARVCQACRSIEDVQVINSTASRRVLRLATGGGLRRICVRKGAKMADLHYMEMGWSGSGWMDPLPTEPPPAPAPTPASPSPELSLFQRLRVRRARPVGSTGGPARRRPPSGPPRRRPRARPRRRQSGRPSGQLSSSAKKSAKKGARKAAKRSAKKAAKRSAKRSTKRSAKRSARKSAKKGARKPARKARRR